MYETENHATVLKEKNVCTRVLYIHSTELFTVQIKCVKFICEQGQFICIHTYLQLQMPAKPELLAIMHQSYV